VVETQRVIVGPEDLGALRLMGVDRLVRLDKLISEPPDASTVAPVPGALALDRAAADW
jgi:hypothetical protein